MRFKIVFALSGILLLVAAVTYAQTVSRWLRIPSGNTPPTILRHHLGAPQSPGLNFQFSYEKTPVRPLERLINRSIPEAAPAPADSEKPTNAGQNAMKLEELNREAEEVLVNPPASTSFAHLFLQQQKKPQNASQTENIASQSSDLPAEDSATGSFLPPASGTVTASGPATIKATDTTPLTASGTTAGN